MKLLDRSVPPAGEVIGEAFRMVHSHPVMLAAFLLGRLGGRELNFLVLGARTVMGAYGNLLLMAGLIYSADRRKRLISGDGKQEETP